MSTENAKPSTAVHASCSVAELVDAAIEVVRASAVGDQYFIPCLMYDDDATLRLRIAIVGMADVLRNFDGC